MRTSSETWYDFEPIVRFTARRTPRADAVSPSGGLRVGRGGGRGGEDRIRESPGGAVAIRGLRRQRRDGERDEHEQRRPGPGRPIPFPRRGAPGDLCPLVLPRGPVGEDHDDEPED